MSHSKSTRNVVQWPADPRSTKAPEKSNADATNAEADDRPAGRITHDERGNAVWKSSSTDSTSTILRKLEAPELQFEGQQERKSVPLAPKAAAKPADPPPVDPGGGYNPYDQRVAAKKPTTPKGPVKRKPDPAA